MTFLSPWMLFGLAALAVPIMLHLWQRRRVVRMPFSTLRFLRTAAAKTSRISRLENLLLLLLRCALLALLVLAAARPITAGRATKFLGGTVPRTVALVIDNSASMSYRHGEETRLDAAKAQALAVIGDLKQGDRVAVIASTDRAELLVAEPTVDHAVVRHAVQAIEQREARSDFSAALREARRIVAREERSVRQVFLFTDNQLSGWKFSPASLFDEEWKQSELRLIVVEPDEITAVNATIQDVTIRTPFITAGSIVSGSARVENFSTAPLSDVLEIWVEENRVTQRAVDAAPGETVEVGFEFVAPSSQNRSARASAKISGDGLAGDNTFFFTLPVYQLPRLLIVEGQSGGPERFRSGFFLQKALTAGSEGIIAGSRTIPAAELAETALEGFSGVFLADPGTLGDRAIERLNRFLAGGGTVAMLPGQNTTIDQLASLEFLPAQPLAIRDLPAGRQPVRTTNPRHPLFANAWNAATPFPALPQRMVIEWQPRPEAEVLLTIGAGAPFLIEGEQDGARAIIVNASPDRAWGDFPLSPAFLPLMQQIARHSATPAMRDADHRVGDRLPVPPDLARAGNITLQLPDGATQPLQLTGSPLLSLPVPLSGFTLMNGPAGTALFTVNIDRRESDLAPMAPAALQKIVAHDRVSGLDQLRTWLSRTHGAVPLWPLMLGLALLVFGCEEVLANVMARRRSQGDAMHIATGRLNKRRMGIPFRAEPAVNA